MSHIGDISNAELNLIASSGIWRTSDFLRVIFLISIRIHLVNSVRVGYYVIRRYEGMFGDRKKA